MVIYMIEKHIKGGRATKTVEMELKLSGTTDEKEKKSLERSINNNKRWYSDDDKKQEQNYEKFKKYEKPGTHANRLEFEADAYAVAQQPNGAKYVKRSTREIYGMDRSPANIERKNKQTIKKNVTRNNANIDEYINDRKAEEDEKINRSGHTKEDADRLKKEMHAKLDAEGKQMKDEDSAHISKKVRDTRPEKVKTQNKNAQIDMVQQSKALKDKTIDRSIYKDKKSEEKKKDDKKVVKENASYYEDIIDDLLKL